MDLAERGSSKLRGAVTIREVETSSEIKSVEDGEASGGKGFDDVARTIESGVFREIRELNVVARRFVSEGVGRLRVSSSG